MSNNKQEAVDFAKEYKKNNNKKLRIAKTDKESYEYSANIITHLWIQEL